MELGAISLQHREPADCVVTAGGEPITALYPYLTEVRVSTTRNGAAQASTATLTFETRRDEHGSWAVQDAEQLIPWEEIVIEASFGDSTEEIMRGYVREVRADYPEDAGEATFVVECQDETLALDRQHVRKLWGEDEETSDGEILQQIADAHGLDIDEDSAEGLSGLVLHQDEPDIRFVRKRATANGYELIVREGAIYFGPPRLGAEPQATIRVYAGHATNCLRFSVNADGHLPKKVAFDLAATEGTDVTRQELSPNLDILGRRPADGGGDGLDDFEWLLSREGAADEAELNARAQQRANDFSMRVTAEGEVDGSLYGHVLLPGLPVGVDGVGSLLGGTYYVDEVTHVFSTDGYRQSFKLIRNAYGDDLEPPPEDPLALIR